MSDKVFLARTASGKDIYIGAETKQHMEAHPDVNMDFVIEAIEKTSYEGNFKIGSVDLGKVVGTDNCIERPASGVENLYRKGREGKTPIVIDAGHTPADTTLLTVGMCLDDDGKHTLFTAFNGQLAPKEPWDKSLREEERTESEKFWASHALICPSEAIDWERSYREKTINERDMKTQAYIDMVNEDGLALQYIKDQTPEICMAAVRENGWAIQFVKKQTPELCMTAVTQCDKVVTEEYDYIDDTFRKCNCILTHVNKQTPAICMAAVQRDGYALMSVRNQTPEIRMAAVKQNGYALSYVRNQTPELCMAAVQQNGEALVLVENQTPTICMAAVQQNGEAIRYVKEQTTEICMAAVQQNGYALIYVKEQTPEICLAAVQNYGCALEYVKNQTPEICMAAVQQNGRALYYVKEQTPEICMAAVQQDGEALKYVRDKEMLNTTEKSFTDLSDAEIPDITETDIYTTPPTKETAHTEQGKEQPAPVAENDTQNRDTQGTDEQGDDTCL